MSVPFLTANPIAIKLKVLPTFNSTVVGRVGIATTKQNGNFFIDLNYGYFPPSPSINPATSPNLYTLLWDINLLQYTLVPITQFAFVDAPNDGFQYGRQSNAWTLTSAGLTDAPSDGTSYGRNNAAWVHVASLASPTFTGTPAAPTATPGTNTTQIATTAFVTAAIGTPGIIPENSKSTNYTTVLGDAGQFIYHPASDANARTFTIAANASVAYTLGTVISFVNLSANALTIAIATDTMYLAGPGTTGSRTLAQYGCCTALKTDTTVWIVSGTGLT
jgi:hypothetical protein